MIVQTTRQYLDVPRGQTVTLFNFGDTLYVGDQTVSASVNESTVLNGGTITLTAGRYLVSAGWSRVEEDITPVQAGISVSTRNSFAIYGDSMTFLNGPSVNIPGTTATDQGYWNWAQFFLGQRAVLTGNYGVSGEDTGQIRARLSSVLGDPAGNVIVLAGTNDIAHGLTTAQTQANLQAIYQALTTAGKNVIAMTVIPRTTVSGPITAPQKKQLLTGNRWIRSYCRSNDGMVLCDPYPYMMDKNGDAATNLLQAADGLHPSRLGAQTMGRVLASVIYPMLPGSLHLMAGRGQGDPYNHLDFSVFDGTTGGTATPFAGTTITGSVTQGWTLTTTAGTGAVSASLVARTDGVPGYWQQIVAAGTGLVIEFFRFGRSEGVNGQGAISRMELDGSTNDWSNCVQLSLQCKDGGNNNYGEMLTVSADSPMTAPGYGVLETPQVLPTADGTSQLCRLRWSIDAGTLRVGHAAIRYPAEA